VLEAIGDRIAEIVIHAACGDKIGSALRIQNLGSERPFKVGRQVVVLSR
jgi:hypothetical protein